MGIEEQNMPPVSNAVKNHPLSLSVSSPPPVSAATWRGDEAADSAAMCAEDVSLPARSKTSLPHCGEVSFPD